MKVPTLDAATIRVALLKLWPITVGACGFVWFAAHGDFSQALAALGLGGAATLSADSLHREDPPLPPM